MNLAILVDNRNRHFLIFLASLISSLQKNYLVGSSALQDQFQLFPVILFLSSVYIYLNLLTSFIHSFNWKFFHLSWVITRNIADMSGLLVNIFPCILIQLCCLEMFHVDIGTPFNSPDAALNWSPYDVLILSIVAPYSMFCPLHIYFTWHNSCATHSIPESCYFKSSQEYSARAGLWGKFQCASTIIMSWGNKIGRNAVNKQRHSQNMAMWTNYTRHKM